MSRSVFGEEAISRPYERYIELSALIQSFVYGLLIAGAIAALYFLDAPAIWWTPVVVGVAAVLCAHVVGSGTLLMYTQERTFRHPCPLSYGLCPLFPQERTFMRPHSTSANDP